MSEHTRWFPMVAILRLAGTGVTAPALARESVDMAGFPSEFAMHTARPFMRNRVMTPHAAARNFDLQNDHRFRRNAQLQNGLPIAIWPHSSFTYTTPMDFNPTQSEVPASPSIIVMSDLPNGVLDRTAPETPPDYGYIVGCRAIPNGYHCDTAPNAAAGSGG